MAVSVPDLRLLIVAADPLVRTGLAGLLQDQPGCTVVGQLAGGPDLPAEVAVYRPDVVVWDLGWEPGGPAAGPGGETGTRSALEILAELREAGLPVVTLLSHEGHAAPTWQAGARSLLLRDASVERLAAALPAAAEGLVVFDPRLAAALLPAAESDYPAPVEALTPREVEVLRLLAEGLPNKAIARRLDISEHTVKFHVNAIMGKLNAQSRTEAVVRATRLGLLLL